MKIGIVGASGFIGSYLVEELKQDTYLDVIAIARSLRTEEQVEWRECDLFSLLDAEAALRDVDVAVYLVHSMMPSAALCQGNFSDYDLILADNFIRACTKNQVKKIIYLGGIIPDIDSKDLSPHLTSRLEVETLILSSSIPSVSLRAGLIVGKNGSSFRIVNRILNTFSVMPVDKRINNYCEPIYVKDVTRVISHFIAQEIVENKIYDLSGPERITYKEIFLRTAKIKNKKLYMFPIAFSNNYIFSKACSLFIHIPFELIYPLFQSLKHSMRANPERKLPFALRLTPLDEMIKDSVYEKNFKVKRQKLEVKEVRSVIRLASNTGLSVEQIAFEYYRWLPRFFKPWIQVDLNPSKRLIAFSLLFYKKPLLILKHSLNRSTPTRHLFYIVGGKLTKRESRGRLGFCSVLDNKTIISSIHGFRPALPWYLYILTQAPIHWLTMKAFARHINKISRNHQLQEKV